MPKKPVIIDLIAVCYFISPFFILIQSAVLNHAPLFGSAGLLARLLWTDYLVLLLYPLCGLAIYSVKKWGWYIFIFSSFYLIIYNIIVHIIRSQFNPVLLVGYNFLLTCLAGFFFRRAIIAPYFNPHLRWWETEPRYRINIFIEIVIENNAYKGEILDISTSGCFINPAIGMNVDDRYIARIHCLGNTVIVKIQVVRIIDLKDNGRGYGVMFINLTQSEKEGLSHIVRELENIKTKKKDSEPGAVPGPIKGIAPRYEINQYVSLKQTNQATIHGLLWDISARGCFFSVANPILLNVVYKIEIHCMNSQLELAGTPKWETELDGAQNSNFPHGYGFQFINLGKQEKTALKAIIAALKKAGVGERSKQAAPLDRAALEQNLANSPYKIIIFLKKIFSNRA